MARPVGTIDSRLRCISVQDRRSGPRQARWNKGEAAKRSGRPLRQHYPVPILPHTSMSIELDKQDRQQAIESIQRYFSENMEEPIGNITAGALLGFFLEEIGPCIYNKAVADARERMQSRLDDIEFEVQEAVFTYWRKFDKQRKPK